MLDWLNPFAWFVIPSFGLGAGAIMSLALIAVILLLGGSGALNLATKVLGGIWDVIYREIVNIADNRASILALAVCMWLAYLYADAQGLKQERALAKERDYFANELRGYKATLARTRAEAAQCVSEMRKLARVAKKVVK